MKIEKFDWYGLEAVLLETDIYEAIVIPSVGANLIKLFNKEKDVNVLITPSANEVDNQFKHWTLWTNDGEADCICPEQQTFADIAPNLKLPEAATGMRAIAGGETWSGTSWLYVK